MVRKLPVQLEGLPIQLPVPDHTAATVTRATATTPSTQLLYQEEAATTHTVTLSSASGLQVTGTPHKSLWPLDRNGQSGHALWGGQCSQKKSLSWRSGRKLDFRSLACHRKTRNVFVWVSSGHYGKIPSARWFKQQTVISHSSGGWEV